MNGAFLWNLDAAFNVTAYININHIPILLIQILFTYLKLQHMMRKRRSVDKFTVLLDWFDHEFRHHYEILLYLLLITLSRHMNNLKHLC